MGSGIKLDGLPHVMFYDEDGNYQILGKAVKMSTETDFDHCMNSVRLDFNLGFNYWGNIPSENEFHPEKSPEHEMARKAAKRMLDGDLTNTFPADDPAYLSTDCTRACYEGNLEVVDINNTRIELDLYDILGFKKPVSFDVKEVIYNDPAVIVYWEDGTKTVATAQNEEYDPEKGLAICFAKKALGNSYKGMGCFKRLLKKAYKKKAEEKPVDKPVSKPRRTRKAAEKR